MATDSIVKRQTPQARPVARSWFDAYKMFLMNPDESFGLKILPLVVIGVLPAMLADDILLPFLGVLDDIPTSILAAFVIFRTWMRVRRYR